MSFLKELKINKYKYLLEFIAVTFGVFLAAQISSCQKQCEADKKTNLLINLTIYEIGENVTISLDILSANRDSTKEVQNYSRIKDNSLLSLLNDENLSKFLSTDQIYILQSYQSIIYKLNYLCDSYINYMLNTSLISDINKRSMRNALIENAAALIAITKLLDITLIGQFKKETPNKNILNNYQKRIQEDIDKIKDGKFKIDY